MRATVREFLAFFSGVAATLLLTLATDGDRWTSLRTSPMSIGEIAVRSSIGQVEAKEMNPSNGCDRSSLERTIDTLEMLTVKRIWTSMVLGQVKVFREKREAFGNKADFAGMAAIMRYYAKQGKCRANGRGGTGGTNSSTDLAIVLLAGANKGESTSQVLRECEAKMHIFEIQEKLFEKQEKRFKDSNLVQVHRLGWSDRVQEMQITMPRDSHELAGLYSPKGKWKNALQLNETVKTIPLATFIQQEGLKHISYVIIDVEGKEPNVLRGMNLEAHQEDFPVFQLELGGTWTDSRHDEDQWGQYAVAMYLTALGYKLFLMGEKMEKGDPMFLPVSAEFFRIISFRPEVDVGGNLLVLHPNFAHGLLEYLQSYVLPTPAVQSL